MQSEDEVFENEVRRVARALWPEDQYAGAKTIDGRERDGVFETEECFHLIEATTSRRLEKARQDIGKLVSLASKFAKRGAYKAVRCWFVTRDEPTVDQRGVAEQHKNLVVVLSLSQFQARLIDARAYLEARDKYAFGSVRNPVTGSIDPDTPYIPLGLVELGKVNPSEPDTLAGAMQAGQRILILGDFGAGKSMTLRYVYERLCVLYRTGQTTRFPVYLNLRDHHGQNDPSEILERHARIIGFATPLHLVRAWRAGFVDLLLDGFDEITTFSIQGLWKKLRDNRYRAMEPVRRLVSEHSRTAGLMIAGRAHYFDNEAERRTSLGLVHGVIEYTLSEFSDAQLQEYLRLRGLKGAIPIWLPSRPLLVAYLASRGLLQEVMESSAEDLGADQGWDSLLDRITLREAQIEAGIDGPTVRRILERLATKARATSEGLGPLGVEDIISAFKETCGYAPDDRGMMLLQRLPGLGIDQRDSDSRRFVDEEFAEACRAGDVRQYIDTPFDASLFPFPIECAAGALGVSLVGLELRQETISAAKVTAAIEHACSSGNYYVAADIAFAALESGCEIATHVVIRDVLLRELALSSNIPDARRISFQDCLFQELELDPEVRPQALPRFQRCYIGQIDGRVSLDDLPAGVFEDCAIEGFASGTGTTSQVLDLSLPLGVRVLITVLKKLFERRGRGRKENALYRGLDHRARALVPEVLQIIRAQGVAHPQRLANDIVWLPDRAARSRAGKIISTPSRRDDSLVVAASKLAG